MVLEVLQELVAVLSDFSKVDSLAAFGEEKQTIETLI